LFVMLMTPPLLAYWQRRALTDPHQKLVKRMALGSLMVGGSYVLLAAVSAASGHGLAGWAWLALFFVFLTFGEIFILPTGLGLFARLAPPHLGATTVAAWFLVIFTGSLSAGFVGTLWSRLLPAQFFALLAGLATVAAGLLLLISRRADRHLISGA
jgi:POT family proton-dependent oligopeptide transporter